LLLRSAEAKPRFFTSVLINKTPIPGSPSGDLGRESSSPSTWGTGNRSNDPMSPPQRRSHIGERVSTGVWTRGGSLWDIRLARIENRVSHL